MVLLWDLVQPNGDTIQVDGGSLSVLLEHDQVVLDVQRQSQWFQASLPAEILGDLKRAIDPLGTA